MAKTYMKLDGDLIPISLDTTISKEEQTKTVTEPNFSSGNVVVTPDANKVLTQVTVVKDNDLVPANIVKDVNIFGVVGTASLPKVEETKTVTPNFSSGNVVVTPTSGKVMTQVTVNKDTTNHKAENIKKDITLYGVTGTLESGGATPTKLATPVVSGNNHLATWSAIPNATSYDIVYYTNYSGAIEIYNQTDTSRDNNIDCVFRVMAKADGFISSDLSNSWEISCFIKGTQITLSNGTTKNVEDITYNDNLLVWDFDKGEYGNAKPLWILKSRRTNKYTKLTFDDGIILSLIGEENKAHRVFDYDKGYFEYGNCLQTGARTINDKGELITLIDKETIYEEVEYYNIITDYHMNLFSNTVLTSCGYNNIYPIENMKFVKDERELIPIEDYNVDSKWYTGLRLGEQDLSLRSIEKAHKYIARMVKNDINQ